MIEVRANWDEGERVRSDVKAYAIKIIGGYLGAGLSTATTEACANAIADRAAANHLATVHALTEDREADRLEAEQTVADLSRKLDECMLRGAELVRDLASARAAR